MTTLAASQKRRLTGVLGLVAMMAIAGAVALNQPASADNLLLQPPSLPNAAASPFGAHESYDVLVVTGDGQGTKGFLNDLPALLYGFAGAFAILAFFAGAYSYFLSGGSEETMSKGRTQMIGSVIAFIIIAGASGIVSVFSKLFSSGKPF